MNVVGFSCECVFGWAFVCVGAGCGGDCWIDGCSSGWGAGEANRLFPQSVLL